MIDREALLKDLKTQVKALIEDLKPSEAEHAKLYAEWQEARDGARTAAKFDPWLSERVTQVAVAWVLATLFVRFCEDNGLIGDPFIAGPDDRTAQARELQEVFFHAEENRGSTDRDWLGAAFGELSKSPVASGLFAERNPMWSIAPSHDAAKALITFWRETGSGGEIVHDFTDPEWDTRYLGDLYQDLSDAARKSYALLQTPRFVEEFILKYTLDPAIEEFGLEPEPPYGRDYLPHRLRIIDPACGSGHFLLGAFRHLLKAWMEEHPGMDRMVLVRNSLQSIHGVDKNPFAVAIARFRLMIEAMRCAGLDRLDARVEFPLIVAVGDSLIHGSGASGRQGEFEFPHERRTSSYQVEDVDVYIKSDDLLASVSYHAVFGNPPYIGISDKREDEAYRKSYLSCYKEYSLAVPFVERFFKLAVPGSVSGGGAGYVGQITANSFMKREFGWKLAKEFIPRTDITHVVDTSGVYVPGHGTPTVILLGRRRFPRASTIRTVRSVKGEPHIPADPSTARVWTQIAAHIDHPGFSGEWVTVEDLSRERYFNRHPWILEAGGLELVERLSESSKRNLKSDIYRVGYYGDSHADSAFILPASSRFKRQINGLFALEFHRGQQLRDWGQESLEIAVLPYDSGKRVVPESSLTADFLKLYWPLRAELWSRKDFSGKTYREGGRAWWEWHQLPRDASGHPWVLAYSDLTTHNHFVLCRSGDAYNRHAPIVRLKAGALEDSYLSLLALLNSSTLCFWLKQVSHDKGTQGVNEGFKSQKWERFYEFTGKNLEQFPLPSGLPLELGRELDSLAQELAAVFPAVVCGNGLPTRDRLDAARSEYERIRGRMIALQEELDWEVYRRYGLLTEAEMAEVTRSSETIPGLRLGERAFEIVLARGVRDEGLQTQWFARHHGSTQTPEIPTHWPNDYRAAVAKRIELIENNRDIGLIERPEYKRRWRTDPWEGKEKDALRNWLLDRCEERSLWSGPDGQPRPTTVNHLADQLRAADDGADVVSVARLYAGDQDADLAKVLNEIIGTEHVPYLAQLRYRPTGLAVRATWVQVWKKQREEEATGRMLDIAAPAKYKSTDFQKPSYWHHRGKLDVPKERFISYPGASPDNDKSLLLGWAGWDHLQQADALRGLIDERESTDGWEDDRIRPLVEGLAEVMPWVRQWHNEIDPTFGQSPADAYAAYLAGKRTKYGIPE